MEIHGQHKWISSVFGDPLMFLSSATTRSKFQPDQNFNPQQPVHTTYWELERRQFTSWALPGWH